MARHSARGRRWKRLRLRAFEERGFRCVKCGKAGRLEAHHVIPVADGGAPMRLTNIVPLCRGCHIKEHAGDKRARPRYMKPRNPPPGRAAWQELADAPIR